MVMLISLVASLGVVALGLVEPAIFRRATELIRRIDFYIVLVKIMLGFLLFAGTTSTRWLANLLTKRNYVIFITLQEP
jgi:hypothetical protein